MEPSADGLLAAVEAPENRPDRLALERLLHAILLEGPAHLPHPMAEGPKRGLELLVPVRVGDRDPRNENAVRDHLFVKRGLVGQTSSSAQTI
jgi:hypothetical protein